MINIKKLQQYLLAIQNEHPGVVNNIFLANNDNHILVSTKERYSQSSILATLLNDSISIIRLTLTGEEEKESLEMIAETDNEVTIAYSIDSNFIYGVTVKRSEISTGRQIASKSQKEISRQFKHIINWVETEPQ